MKEIWCEIYDRFVAEHEREPTEQEMQDAWADYCSGLIDCYKD